MRSLIILVMDQLIYTGSKLFLWNILPWGFFLMFRLKKEAIQYRNKSMKQHVSCPMPDQLDFSSQLMYYKCTIHLLILFSTVFENIQAVQESPGQDFKVVEFHWSPWWYLTQNRPCCIWRNGKVTQKKYHTRSVIHCQSLKVMNRAMRKPFCRKKIFENGLLMIFF